MFLAEDIVSPFWGAPTEKLGGRDPLGIQNSSVVVYSTLVPGLTNLTQRVRYNGFYCWLLRDIAKHLIQIDPSLVDVRDEQLRYIRRAELLLAYIMVGNQELGDPNGVSGSQFARKHLSDAEDIDLVLGADRENGLDKTYWRNSMGVFGQYYVGALIQLGLVCAPGNDRHTYRCTQEGEQLADAFEANIFQKEELFWQSIFQTEKVRKEVLHELICFSLTTIPEGSELEIYRSLFLGRDVIAAHETLYRSETIKGMLSFIQQFPAERRRCSDEYLRNIFETVVRNGFDSVTDVEKTWFLYELNELVHSSYEAFHFGVLNRLSYDPVSLDGVFRSLLGGLDELCEVKGVSAMKDFKFDVPAHSLYRDMLKLINSSRTSESIFNALWLLQILMSAIGPMSEEISVFAAERHLNRRGIATSLLQNFFEAGEDLSVREFAEQMLYNAINAHMKSSYEKSTVTQGLVHNYMMEEGSIWRLRETYAIRTSPRLDSLLMYMEDMKLIRSNEDSYIVEPAGLILIDDGR